jgi:hypothetical protein
MNREEYLKKLKESVEAGKIDEDLTSHHYAILDKAAEKSTKARHDVDKSLKSGTDELNLGYPSAEENIRRIREEGKPSEKDRIRFNESGNIEHVDQTSTVSPTEKDLLIEEQLKLKKYVSQINEILGEEKVSIKNGDIIVIDKNEISPEQITRDRVIKEITLLEQENQKCYAVIAKNNDLLTYLKIELSTL